MHKTKRGCEGALFEERNNQKPYTIEVLPSSMIYFRCNGYNKWDEFLCALKPTFLDFEEVDFKK